MVNTGMKSVSLVKKLIVHDISLLFSCVFRLYGYQHDSGHASFYWKDYDLVQPLH
jgi:hypothetical protein